MTLKPHNDQIRSNISNRGCFPSRFTLTSTSSLFVLPLCFPLHFTTLHFTIKSTKIYSLLFIKAIHSPPMVLDNSIGQSKPTASALFPQTSLQEEGKRSSEEEEHNQGYNQNTNEPEIHKHTHLPHFTNLSFDRRELLNFVSGKVRYKEVKKSPHSEECSARAAKTRQKSVLSIPQAEPS